MRFGFTLSNFKEMREMLVGLPPAVESRVMGIAVAKAARYIVAAAKERAPVRTGALRKSIIAVVRRYPRRGIVMALIGPDKNYYGGPGARRLKAGDDASGANRPKNYAHLVEFGHYTGASSGKFGGYTKGHKRKKSRVAGATVNTSQDRAYVMPQPFLRPAVAAGKARAEAALADGVRHGMEREIKRIASRMKQLGKITS